MAKKKQARQEGKKDFVVGLQGLYNHPKPRRAKKGIALLKRFAFKHLRIAEENVLVSNNLNEFIWHKGRENVPRKVRITAVVSKGKANLFLKGEKIPKPKEEKKPEKKPEKKTEEEKAAEEEKEKKKEEKKLAEKAAEKAAIKRGKE
jgi:ribosomal protein L31E